MVGVNSRVHDVVHARVGLAGVLLLLLGPRRLWAKGIVQGQRVGEVALQQALVVLLPLGDLHVGCFLQLVDIVVDLRKGWEVSGEKGGKREVVRGGKPSVAPAGRRTTELENMSL